LFFSELLKYDPANILKEYICIGRVSSKDNLFLKNFLSIADAVSAWGNEESLKSLKEMIPSGARVIEWGHKISFCYVSNEMINDEMVYDLLSNEICLNEQQACSSPQCIFVENADFETLKLFGKKLKKSLDKISPTIDQVKLSEADHAQITISKEQVRLDSFLGETQLIEDENSKFRIYIDMKEGLEASPLFRTIWLKPLNRSKIIQTLRPLKKYLQTVGLSCAKNEVENLVSTFLNCGVQRVRSVGEMTNSYIGEPHDGELALSRYCQKISYTDSGLLNNRASFEGESSKIEIMNQSPIMNKQDFQAAIIDDKYSELFFHSGGSSGEPKLSIFTYDDYHRQMEMASEGLYAAGLDPINERCMNLFYAGNLYGGFVSFFTILEKMEAVQFPMGASTEFITVAEAIIKNKVNTILGMPSYIMQLFTMNDKLFRNYRGITKVFFGGEHMSLSQRNFLKNEYGVQLIRSASYGSVDAGPLGYQCTFSSGSIYHLHDRLHCLEIVNLEKDELVKNGKVGRMLFTSKVRHGQNIKRYDIGDVGRIIEDKCECGRTGCRFELLGRSGDVFRIGTIFLSYQRFQKILIDYFEYEGAIQIELCSSTGNQKEKIILLIEETNSLKIYTDARQFFIDKYLDLHEVVIKDQVLDFEVKFVNREKLVFNQNTGKLRSVIDHRFKL
jgi:phenylacetate-coenzyme A ligase PaaK-like adenylate-forming protein